jgi:hypothetical protein
MFFEQHLMLVDELENQMVSVVKLDSHLCASGGGVNAIQEKNLFILEKRNCPLFECP